jgi:hypothetical protein
MSQQPESTSEPNYWSALLDATVKPTREDRPFPDKEITKQLSEEWGPYLVMGSEVIQ